MQAEPAHVSLSFFDWTLALGVVVIAWWAIRALIGFYAKAKSDLQKAQQTADEDRARRILKQQESLEKTMQELIKELAGLKSWVAMEFVRREDHQRDIDQLRSDLADHRDAFLGRRA